jgi:hypothetical protein
MKFLEGKISSLCEPKIAVPVILAIASTGFGGGSCIAAARDWGYDEPASIVRLVTITPLDSPTSTPTTTPTSTPTARPQIRFATPERPVVAPEPPRAVSESTTVPQATPVPSQPPIIILHLVRETVQIHTPTPFPVFCWPPGHCKRK